MTRKKILLAENDIDSQSHHICKVFLESGYQVKTAPNGRLAYEEIIKNHYDLVISDLNLPQINGISLLKRVKECKTNLPVILIADEACVNEAVEAMKLGADDFLLKPLTPKMVQIIHSVVANGSNGKRKNEPRKKFEIITQNKDVEKLLEIAKDVADSKASIFIQGESGTGKELFARYIHHHSSRKDEPFVAVNCAALPENLLESELFGHEKGAFTGAISRKKGKFELANHGTLLLDEVTEMDYQLQSKLLRVLQEREIDRIGGMNPVPVDVRFLATTNRDIEKQIEVGKFREDLHYRLNVIPLHLPPLRERKDDIPLLAEHFIKKYCELDNRSVKGLKDEAIASLVQMTWKGNVRELENVIRRAIAIRDWDFVFEEFNLENLSHENERVSSFGDHPLPPVWGDDKIQKVFSDGNFSLKKVSKAYVSEAERQAILGALKETQWNRKKAAQCLRVSYKTLLNRLTEFDLKP